MTEQKTVIENNGLTLKEKIGYGFGDAAASMFWKLFSMYLLFFYTDIFGIPAAAVGTMFLLTRIWDAANDTIMGIICDRTTSRWGKFRPYILWVAVPFAIVGVLTFTTPDLDLKGKIVWAYLTYTLMMMVYTAINVPYASLLGVMTSDSGERTTLASYRMLFGFAGSLLVLGSFEPLVGFLEELFGGDNASQKAWQYGVAVFGVLAVVFFMFNFSWTNERIQPSQTKTSLKKDIKDLIGNRPWFILLGAAISTLIFNSVRDGVAIYYFRYYVIEQQAFTSSSFNLTMTFSALYLVIGQAANMVGVILAKPVSIRIGKKTTFFYAMVLAALLSVLFFWIPAHLIWLIYLFQFMISICAGIIFPLLWSMFGDIADYSEIKNGRRATGLIFSSSSMSQKFGWTLGGALTGWLLAWFGFVANAEQTTETLIGLKLMLSIIPAAGALLSAAFIWFYGLSDDYMNSLKRKQQN